MLMDPTSFSFLAWVFVLLLGTGAKTGERHFAFKTSRVCCGDGGHTAELLSACEGANNFSKKNGSDAILILCWIRRHVDGMLIDTLDCSLDLGRCWSSVRCQENAKHVSIADSDVQC